MKLWKRILIIAIEALLMGYISFSVFSGYYDGYKWTDKDKCYYSEKLTVSDDIVVSLKEGGQYLLKRNSEIQSCAVDRNGYIVDAYFGTSDNEFHDISGGIAPECFVEKETIIADSKELFIKKDDADSIAVRSMIIEYCLCFLISLVPAIIIMLVSRSNIKIHIVLIILLALISLSALCVVGLGGFDHPLR